MEKYSRFHETVKLCLLTRKSIEFSRVGKFIFPFLIQFADEIGSEIKAKKIRSSTISFITCNYMHGLCVTGFYSIPISFG
jgi:hypothetical protein